MVRSVPTNTPRNDSPARRLHARAGSPGHPGSPGRCAGAPGFTLLETMMALVIIGVGVLAFVDAQQSFTRQNDWSSLAQMGTYMANEIRELTRQVSRHDPVTGLYFEGSGAAAVLRGWGLEAGEVTVQDLDDLDDFDGQIFGQGGTFPGPINAFGEVMPRIDPDGAVVVGPDGRPLPMQGWTQAVFVEKVDPNNSAAVLADDYPRPGVAASRPVDQYPLRVTVIVSYQGPYDTSPQEITRVRWIVP